jgi:hypothetical protein
MSEPTKNPEDDQVLDSTTVGQVDIDIDSIFGMPGADSIMLPDDQAEPEKKSVFSAEQTDMTFFDNPTAKTPEERKEAAEKQIEVEETIKENSNFAEDTETLASTYAHANRSGVNIAPVDGSFDSTNDVFEIQDNLEKEAVNISKIVMKINKLNTANLVCFCDSISYRKFEFYANQGTGNSVNTSFQYSGVNFVHSVGLDALFGAMGYDLGAWIIAPAGTFGVMDWTPKQNREGFVEPGIAQYGVINNPLLGINHGFHMYAERSDAQASGGYYQDVNYEWQFTTMLGFVKAPLTTATESVFQAFAIIPTVVA